MWLQSVVKKQRGESPEKVPVMSLGEIPTETQAEIQDLRRRISEFQAASVREKRGDEVLRESEERFRRIFEEGPLGMAMSDPYFHFIKANAALCRMLGYAEKELTSLTFKDITHPDHVNGDTESLKKLLHGEIPFYRTEKRYVRKDKEVVWGEVTVSAIRDGSGQFQYFLAQVEDITARKQTNGALAQSEQKYRELADALPSCIFETDLDGSLIFANQTAYEWFGYTQADFQAGLRITEFLVEADRTRATENFRRVLSAGEASSGEYTVARKDGTTFPGLITARTITKNGRPAGLLGMVMDISERRRVEKELRENEEKYRMLFESANDAIFLMDFEQFIDCNSNTLDMFGCEKRGDIVGHSPWDYSPDKQPDGRDSRDKAREHISAALDGKPQRFSWRHCRKDRTPFEAEVSLTSLILAGKKHLLAVVRDITERTQAERLQNAVYQISQAADKSSSLDDLFRSVHENIRTVMPAGNFYIALYDADKDLISFPYFVDEVDSPPAPLKPGKGLTEYVIRKGRSLLCDEATDQDLRGRGEVEVVGAPSAIWLGVPLSVENKTIGVMTVQHYSDPKAYGERELRMLEFVSTQVARSIERKRAEAELRENEQRLSLHVQQTPLAVIEWDKDFRVLQWNPAAEKIFGHPAEEAVGQHAAFIVPERFKEHVHQVWNDLMARKGGQRSTNENTTKDGRTIFCEWYNTSLVNSEGQVIGVASLAQDVTERKLSEEALLASEERFKNLFEKSAEAQLLLDHESNVIDCNTAFLRLFALQSKAEVLGRSPEDFAPEFQPDGTSSHERGLEVIRTVMEKGSARFEWEHRKHDDARTPIHNELICTMISIADRPMLHVAIRDITDRKAAEEALKSSEERLKLLYEYAPEAYYLSDLKGNFIDGNREAEKTLGFRKEEIIGQSFLKLKILSTSQLPKAAALLAKNALGKSTGPDEFILNRKDGTQVTTEIRTYPIKIKNQTLVLGIARDITERKQAEEALRDSEELHRKLLTSIPDMIIRTDLNGKILFANEVAVRAGGFSGGLELVGRNIFSFVSSEDRERAEASAKIMFEKRIDPQEVHLVLNGGSKILYEINGAVLRSPDQTPYGMVFLCRDITERKKAETDLHQSLKKLRTTLKAAIDSLASAIEMRDPYTAGHQERVTRLASAIAAEMSLDEDRIEGIQIAGIIHDIGKLYVPAEILSKPTKLSELEYSMIKMHSQVGYTILSKIDFPWPIAQIVHQHHETVNGSGYPLGLTGKDILLEAKILCVADVVEAMSSHRPYRPALGIQAALDEISQKRGILFDREVVDACLRLFAGKKFKFD